jgi:hypothetical protein
LSLTTLTNSETSSFRRFSYDYDTDPEKRAETPDFYGYIPDEGRQRVVLLVLMTFNGATMLLARCLGVALLLAVGTSYLFGFLAADMGIYLTYKVARSDFYHWLPVEGPAAVLGALLERVVVKTVADFTGVVQFRASGELGGIYFTVNTAMGFVICFAAIKIFFGSDVGRASRIEEGGAMEGFAWLCGFWLVTAALGVSLIKKEYRGTFVSFETGNGWCQKFFLEGETDEIKSKTLSLSKMKWMSIREPAKEWVQEGWWRWKEDKPGWFGDAWIANLPDDFIPEEVDRKVLEDMRRRSSVFGGVGGGVGVGGGATIVPVEGPG